MLATQSVDGVQHLYGDLYRVKSSLIQYSEKGEEGLTFFNPRHVLTNAKPKGFSKEEMGELREAIRSAGLKNPLILRWCEVDGNRFLQLVDGERRKRCIDKLIKEDVDCYDAAEERNKPASELYDYVDCRINELDDQFAFKIAFTENGTAVDIGDGATIALVDQFRKAGWIDDQILYVTGKSISWLRDTDSLFSLDEVTFKALVSSEINRSAALKLLEIESIEERVKILENAKDFAAARISVIKEKLENEVASAENKIDFAEAVAIEAIHRGDEDKKQEAEEKIEKASKRRERKKKEIEELDESGPKITSKDVHNAKKAKDKNQDDSDDGKRLTPAKVSKHWYEPIAKAIKQEGLDEDGNDLEIDLDDAKLVIRLLEAIENGERDAIAILQDHKLSKDELVDEFSDADDEDVEGYDLEVNEEGELQEVVPEEE